MELKIRMNQVLFFFFSLPLTRNLFYSTKISLDANMSRNSWYTRINWLINLFSSVICCSICSSHPSKNISNIFSFWKSSNWFPSHLCIFSWNCGNNYLHYWNPQCSPMECSQSACSCFFFFDHLVTYIACHGVRKKSTHVLKFLFFCHFSVLENVINHHSCMA